MELLKIQTVNSSNWRQIISLQVAGNQQRFIEKNEISLLESVYDTKHDWKCYGLFENKTPVGFVMIGVENKEDRYIWLDRFMMDAKFQGRGLGTAFLLLIIEFIANQHEVDEIVLSIIKENSFAKAFYVQHGFDNTGLVDEEFDEEIFVYRLDRNNGK
ncbi:GNAT family N-acetyltransferase [Bacillus sp. RO2]|uniref:GNAT family N-acetyltransferase n=1 Tax=Bacillus sp. RO2 TaxID=2723913 RepID=UPI00145F3504|nr:GNAT family N-acetyltransferase [Bacillus sp. RO2]NMH72464.1 GNAT family N-acetyltransferase [Bacillus sp. RO2]